MKRQRLYIMMLLMAIAVGCRKDETSLDELFAPSGGEIAFASEDNWDTTKSTVIGEETLKELGMEVFAFYTAAEEWSSADVAPQQFMIDQSVAYNSETSAWSYSPVKYWPNNESEKITFFAFAPDLAINHSFDTTGKPQFSHTLSTLASENEDLVAAVQYDQTKQGVEESTSGSVEFSFAHALTKITIKAKIIDSSSDTKAGDITNEKYIISAVSISGVQPTRSLTIDENGTMSWSDDDDTQTPIEVTAAQGVTLKSKDDYNLLGNYDDGKYVEEDAVSVMAENNDRAIFLLPQELESGNLPKLQIRVRQSYEESGEEYEMIYQTVAVDFPTTATDGTIMTEWEMGQHIALTFTFDIGKLDQYETPLAVSSEVFGWSETDVDIDMHSNLYIYSSKSDIDAVTETIDGVDVTYGDFMICTNYDYNLRVPHHRKELDGSITSSRGFLFYSNDFADDETLDVGTYSYTDSEGVVQNFKIFIPTLLSDDGDEIHYAKEANVTEGAQIYQYAGTDGYDGTNYTTLATAALPKVDDDGNVTDSGNITIGSHDLAYLNDNGTYRLLYLDPNNGGALTAFNYDDDGEIKLSAFADIDEGTNDTTVKFKIQIMTYYEFDFQVTKSTRERQGLYTSGAISGDSSYGVNKSEDDPVYILRLSVNSAHLASAGYKFDDIIGVEMITNGGGMSTQLFPVTLTDPTATSNDIGVEGGTEGNDPI
ncbi:MAG: hypothetical protein SNG04_05660 [Rikenellaceae bacterium]